MYNFSNLISKQIRYSAADLGALANMLPGSMASQSYGSAIIDIFFMSLFSTLWDTTAKLIGEQISTSKHIKDSREALNKLSHSLKNRDGKLLLSNEIKLACDSIERQIESILSVLYGGDTLNRTASALFLGPPGLGKTSLFKHIFSYAEKTSMEFSQKKIEFGLSKQRRNEIQKMRKLSKDGRLIVTMFFPGAFFLQYGEAKLRVFEDFKEKVQQYLQEGHVVIICIDEIDGLLYAGKDKRHSLGNLFIFGIDELKNGVKSGKFPGALILLGSSNNPDLDYGMSRRVGEEIIVFNYPDSVNQGNIFESKLKILVEKIKKGNYSKEEKSRLNFSLESVMKEVLNDIKIFNGNGIDFSGSEFENIVNNFCIFMTKSKENDLVIFGSTSEERIKNILKYFFLKESLKIMKIRQHLVSAKIQDILDSLYNQIKISKKIPKLDSGTDWKSS